MLHNILCFNKALNNRHNYLTLRAVNHMTNSHARFEIFPQLFAAFIIQLLINLSSILFQVDFLVEYVSVELFVVNGILERVVFF